ncbi:MAG: DUF3080 family protein [Pseudomonas sp.]|uniref:DUF3080 family protein n=1 Tax=Pseudomonas sp. TaxID=306 RepID=UPI00271CFB96|nr:DUF3080 family protein [Pseudomonas sp.]MDO9618292.1 DUF3080 family protein [Pseudomonas sp.]MDP2446745.1 DUF3080 family protein [Pseudomonas sp.]MDZ4332724.1 DUF3080 family protein [Pseudomonas sp.]
MNARLLLLLAALCLCACTPADDGLALQADYLQRLSNALDVEPATTFDPRELPRYRLPARRERLIEIAELRISLLKLLVDVRRCPALQQQISQRNNSLGKQLTPSSRLAYEGDLLRALDACSEHLRSQDQQPLRNTLEQLAQEKRAQLPGVFWNALNASPEVERYLRFAERPLPPYADEDSAALDALAQLASIGSALPATLPPSAEQLDPLFFALHASDQGGQLISSLASLTHSLNQGSDMLQSRQQGRPLCPTGKATERARIVQNIFVKYYAGSLQPYLAQVDQRGQTWSSSLRSLSNVTQIPPATQQYLQSLSGQEASLWADFQHATARHVRSWQELLNSCALAPGQSGWTGNAASANQ